MFRALLLLLSVSSLLVPGAVSAWTLDEALMPENVSLTFTHRTRYEGLDDPFRTANAGQSYTDILVHRTLIHGRVTLPGRVTIGAELQDSRAHLTSDSIRNNTIQNALEILQAYAAIEADVSDGHLLARGGRITMDVGSRRFVARNRYRNTINGFTGLDFDWHEGEGGDALNVRAFFTLPVERAPNPTVRANRSRRLREDRIVMDEESFDVLFWGLFVARDLGALPLGIDLRGEAYLFGLHESDAPDRPTRNRQLFTPGFRLFSKPAKGELDVTLEAALQVGQSRASTTSTRELDHLAWFVHQTTGYTFDAPWSPRLAFQFDFASGDSNPLDGNNNRFDTLFGARRFDFGPTGIFGPFARSNIISPGLRLQVKPSKRVSSFVAARTYWLADRRDGWTTSGVRDDFGESGDHVGTILELRVRWTAIPDNLKLEAGYAHFFKGEYVKRGFPTPDTTPPGLVTPANDHGDSEYVYTQATLSF